MNETADREASIYAEAEAMPAGQRAAYLEEACAGDSELRKRLEELLADQPEADTFFESLERETRPDFARAIEAPGKWIDCYLLKEQIGEGGCGIVYRAEQETPVQREVALKIIKLGMDTRQVVARFEAERQALALMNHPHIARVLDAGATETGRPYFVMELVHGTKITEFCDQHRLTIPERLDLFIQVCRAIQHAHQKGVIHRDIKPSNVLVSMQDGSAFPKVIDFGVAKATQGRLTKRTVFSGAQAFIGTPAYMSPEQAENGQDLDIRTDVYSLGMVLCELLTGQTPFDSQRLSDAGITEMLRIVREEEPRTPSALLAALAPDKLEAVAASRGLQPSQLLPAVRGDLDWIVLKTWAKDRGDRYDTVNGLALDLRRFLNDEPVTARPPSRLYLFGKLVRRNKAIFASAAVVVLALVAGLVASSWFYVREREARQVQVKLREAAETAQANEARLLQQSRAREKVSEAAILLAGGKTEEADALLAKTPLTSVEPSLEAANLFRTLGEWNAIRQRWKMAADCYAMFLQANRLDRAPSTPGSLLVVIFVAPTLLEGGNLTEYRRFSEEAVDRHGKTTDPINAAMLIKACMLHPADKPLLERLRPAADVVAGNLARNGSDAFQSAHMAMSLALLEYRRGNFAAALEQYRRCLAFRNKDEPREAAIRAVAAMAAHRLGERGLAQSELAQAREILSRPFPENEQKPRGSGWQDWAIARVLLREAAALVDPNGGAKR